MKSHPFLLRACVLAGALPLLAACGGADYELAPVSGRVTLKGQPLAGVHVQFQPRSTSPRQANACPGSFGVTDADGRYTLETMDGSDTGAVVGKHEVRLTLNESGGDDDPLAAAKTPIPPKYRNGELEFTVPAGGSDQANFEM